MTATQFSQVVLASWRQRDRSAPWGRLVLALLLVGSLVITGVFAPLAIAWRIWLGIAVFTLHCTWWVVGLNLSEQNHPHAARCVPGHLRALRQAALLAWVLHAGATTSLVVLILPGHGHWELALLVNSAIATFLLWSARLWWLWLLLIFQSPLIGALSQRLAPLGAQLSAAWLAQPQTLLALALLLQAGLVTLMFDDGGPRHRERYARQTQRRAVMRMMADGRQPNLAAWGGRIEWLFRPFERMLSAWRQRLLAQAGPHNVMARADIVLRGPQHWLNQALTFGTMAAVMALIFAAVCRIYELDMAKVWRTGGTSIGLWLVCMGLNPAFMLPNALWQSRREQALLRLLPGMPQGAALNRAVAGRQLRDCFVTWLVTLVVLCVVSVNGYSPALPYLALGALPVAVLSLTRRPALMRAPTPGTTVLPVFAYLGLGGLLYLAVDRVGVPRALVITVVPIVSAGLLAWRWRVVQNAPAALPAGRLA
ncbi:hypothetical protein [Pelomonas cellulosilytica]|uniref:Uncharacterized protein n=1 Tax=Pelomonas cellulosilytica TaxID=2906762 RepID=A0ABS8XS83_9BURK|nr:hypothetical protein [Pelomonas sp. P8]MCE4555572.1 hypothetical protein [Pelomonas sp. P8]